LATHYTMSWILPFMREALRPMSNFSFETFIDALWRVMENAKVEGIVRKSQTQGFDGTNYQINQAPYPLTFAAAEGFSYLLNTGYIMRGIQTNLQGFPSFAFHKTTRGEAWAASAGPVPEDVDGYLNFLRKLVPILDPVMEQYVTEGLKAYERGTYFASAVMVGAASEKGVYLLGESMRKVFKDPKQTAKLEGFINGRSMNSLFGFIQNVITQAQQPPRIIPYSVTEGASPHLISLIEAIRVQRNDAVHPQNASVSADSVRLSYLAFPHALQKLEELRAWFLANPGSL